MGAINFEDVGFVCLVEKKRAWWKISLGYVVRCIVDKDSVQLNHIVMNVVSYEKTKRSLRLTFQIMYFHQISRSVCFELYLRFFLFGYFGLVGKIDLRIMLYLFEILYVLLVAFVYI